MPAARRCRGKNGGNHDGDIHKLNVCVLDRGAAIFELILNKRGKTEEEQHPRRLVLIFN